MRILVGYERMATVALAVALASLPSFVGFLSVEAIRSRTEPRREFGMNVADWCFDKDARVRAAQIRTLKAMNMKYVRSNWPNMGRGGDPDTKWFDPSHEVAVCKDLSANGITPIRCLVNNNEGIESTVSPDQWRQFLDWAKGEKAIARIGLAKAGILSRDERIVSYLESFARSEAERLPNALLEAVNPDVWFAGTDGHEWLAHERAYERALEAAGFRLSFRPLGAAEAFLDRIQRAVGTSRRLLRYSNFLYDWRGGDIRWTGLPGAKREFVCEVGVSIEVDRGRRKERMEKLSEIMAMHGVTIACWHQGVDPSEGPWTWPKPGGTQVLWSQNAYESYKRSKGRIPDPLVLLPSAERDVAKTIAGRKSGD